MENKKDEPKLKFQDVMTLALAMYKMLLPALLVAVAAIILLGIVLKIYL